MKKRLYLDLETTGFNSYSNGITELGAIYVEDDVVVEGFNCFINPYTYNKKMVVVNEAISFRGVTEADLLGYATSKESFNDFIKWLDSICNKFDKKDKIQIVGYNSDTFDIKFLKDWFKDSGNKYYGSYFSHETIDVFNLVKKHKIKKEFNLKNDKLSTIAEHYNIEINAHIAMDDIIATYKIHQILSNLFDHNKMIKIKNKIINNIEISKTEDTYYKNNLNEMLLWVYELNKTWRG